VQNIRRIPSTAALADGDGGNAVKCCKLRYTTQMSSLVALLSTSLLISA